MATRGRRPTATAVAKKRGTLKKNKHRRDDSNSLPVDGQVPERPDFLDEYAEEKWAELVPMIAKLGIMSADMSEMLISYCEAYAGWRRCREIIKQDGEIVPRQTNQGVVMGRNPAATSLFAYRQQMDRLLPEFGLTPSSKTRLKQADDKQDEDPFAALAARLTGDN